MRKKASKIKNKIKRERKKKKEKKRVIRSKKERILWFGDNTGSIHKSTNSKIEKERANIKKERKNKSDNVSATKKVKKEQERVWVVVWGVGDGGWGRR